VDELSKAAMEWRRASPNHGMEPTRYPRRGSGLAFGPSSTRGERRYAPAEATVVIGKIAFEFPLHHFIRQSKGVVMSAKPSKPLLGGR
jgi:hypothetical protein